MKRRLQGMMAAALLAAAGQAWPADNYPSRPIRIVIPFAPGGTVDILGRVLGEQLGDQLVALVSLVPADLDHDRQGDRDRLVGRLEHVPGRAHDVQLAVDGLCVIAEEEVSFHVSGRLREFAA